MSTIDTRREQMFPKLEPRESDRLRRFGTVRRYAPGEALFVTGEIAPGMSVLIKGSVRVTRRYPLGHSAPLLEQGPGEFIAEVGQLSGQPAFVDVHAIDDVEALLIPSENLRALMIEEPELGERIMRALILRRVALIEAGADGPVLIGPESSPDVIRLQGFLARNAYPHQLLDGSRCGGAGQAICPESRGSAAGRVSERLGPEKPERDRIGAGTRNGANRRTGSNLRRRGCRRGTRWPLDRGLCRIGGSLGDRLRRARLRWTSWSERSYRKLSRFPNRHFWPDTHWPRLCPGAEI